MPTIEAQLLARCERERDEYRRQGNEQRRRIEDALLHYQIGREAAALLDHPTFVDWRYVAEQMAAALRGDGKDTPTAGAVRCATCGEYLPGHASGAGDICTCEQPAPAAGEE